MLCLWIKLLRSVSVSFSLYYKFFHYKLNENLFVAQVDASNINEKKRLAVILSKQPSFTDIVKIKPSRVEFLLIKE